MPNGWQALGTALGGDSEDAYEKGLALGANTQNALAQARARVDQNAATNQLGEVLGQIPGVDPKIAAGAQVIARAGGKPEDVMAFLLKNQEYGFRQKAGDPNVPFAEGNRAMMGVGPGGLHERFGFHDGMMEDKLSNEQPTVTPIGESMIGKNNATATHALNAPPSGANTPPKGYTWETDPTTGERKLKFIPGGPADPDKATNLGSREATFLQRVVTGAKLGLENLRNVMDLPSGASTGIMGIGAAPGHSVFQSTRDTLRNAMTGDDVQAYNTMLAGLSRNLATIETSGLLPSAGFTDSFNNLAFREGDTEATKLHKLAEMRQIIEYGMDVGINNPRISNVQKGYLQSIVDDIQKVVPFTHADVTRLQHTDGMTLGQMIQAHGLPKPAPHIATPAATPSAAPPAGGETRIINGKHYVKVNGQWFEDDGT